MTYSELSEQNFRRISIINWILTPAMLIVFAWPYYLLADILGIRETYIWVGSFIFASPFMMTVLHGHVTMAMGAVHRHHYYDWLKNRPLTYGILFHPIMFRTRFRLSLVIISAALLPVFYLLS